MMHHHHRGVVSYNAVALHQGDRLQANSVVQKLGERDRVYVLTQTVPLQKKKTIFKKRLESHIAILEYYQVLLL